MWLLFVAATVKVAVGILASVLVLGAPAPAAPALPTWYYLALLVIFQLSAAWLFIGGRRDVRARALATLFVLFATLFSDRIVIRATAFTPDSVDRAMLLIAAVQLVAFCPYAFWRFAYTFPRPLPVVGRHVVDDIRHLDSAQPVDRLPLGKKEIIGEEESPGDM